MMRISHFAQSFFGQPGLLSYASELRMLKIR